MNAPTQRTALFDLQQNMGAKMIAFAGWEMPVWFSSMIKEHQAVRESAGVFDISHMGLVQVHGPGALALLNHLFTRDLTKLKPWRAQYGLMCNADGGILDDLIVYKAPDHLRVVMNAGNLAKITAWITEHAKNHDATVTPDPGTLVKLAIQGPKVAELVQPEPRLHFTDLPRYGWKLAGERMLLRTGYTGEDGFELVTGAAEGRELYLALVEKLGVTPVGLGARDTLRLEHGLSLYGNEIHEGTHAFEAGLAWVVNLDKPDFIGREALLTLKEAGNRTLVGLTGETGGASPRHSDALHDSAGAVIGEITSGSHSPTLGKPIALGYVPRQHAQLGHAVFFTKGGKQRPLTVTERNFLKPSH